LLKKNLTKAESLKFLQKFSKDKFIIPKFIYFSLGQYKKNKAKIINKIQLNFKNQKIIIRSSAIDEDGKNKSNAGKYLSIVILIKNQKNVIGKAIDKVIKKFNRINDQILVQSFLDKPDMSGVIFTKDPKSSSDYYIINYDKSKKTDLITSGKKNIRMKTELVFKEKIALSKNFFKYLKIIKLIEKKYKNDSLDIEFAIKNKKLIIFQCRNLILKNKSINITDALTNIYKKINKISNNPLLPGKTTILSNMADWNPAEIIGFKPSNLSISLYDTLITKNIWAIQRDNYGYKNVQPNALMFNLFGFPYIDLKTDINSFLPKDLPDKISNKIVNNSINKISNAPYLHDKIEFEVIETCYDFFSEKRIDKFLNKKEKKIYIFHLKKLTNNILVNGSSRIKSEMAKLKSFESKLSYLKKQKISEVQKIHFLIHNIKSFGTLPFAGIARIAFITTKILRSFVSLKIINETELEKFYESIDLCTKDILISANKAFQNKNLKIKFIKEYGHLRPSTYSITSKNYEENFKKYFIKKKINHKARINFKFNNKQRMKMNHLFKSHKLQLDIKKFLLVARTSIKLREEAKLIFTKGINEVFVNLIKLGKEMKISRDDLQFLSIKEFENRYQNLDINKLSKILKKNIQQNKKDFKYLKYINLPDIIISPKCVYQFEKSQVKGNFITNKIINGNILNYTNIINKKLFINKIVLIENADPGFDFLFGLGIKGLITQYGGANSHMAIRCLEENIPACIGIGEKSFDIIKKSKVIELNCFQDNYKILS